MLMTLLLVPQGCNSLKSFTMCMGAEPDYAQYTNLFVQMSGSQP